MLRSFVVGALSLAFSIHSSLALALEFVPILSPAGQGAQEPVLFALKDGRVALSWLEPEGAGFALKVAVGSKDGWGDAHVVHSSDNMFINWADFPSIAAFDDGTLAAHWLQDSANSGYAYDVNIALSKDDGANWSAPITPHRDGTTGQHGFVTLLPVGAEMMSVWLDSRAYKKNRLGDQGDLPDAMQLRATKIGTDGGLSEDVLLDARTCTCCQTDAATTSEGNVVAVYRDKTKAEIRDIAVVRLEKGTWSEPEIIHADGWEISGCPVNGPAIDSFDKNATVAWFTAANDDPAVKIAWSGDGGLTFGSPLRIDQADAVGRVDVIMLDEARSLVTWVEWRDAGEAILSCVFDGVEKCEALQQVAENDGLGSVNFPNMARTQEGIYFAWSKPAPEQSKNSERDASIEIRFAPFEN